jgi:cell shape-determining protein MreD
MILRWPLYVLAGWIASAAVASLAHEAHFSLVLPQTSAILVVHSVFAFPHLTSRQHLAVAIALGYLDDLHHQAIIGSSTLAHVFAYALVAWIAPRISTQGQLVRMGVAGLASATIVLVIGCVSLLMAPRLGFSKETLLAAWPQGLWQVLATVLVTSPLWLVMDWLLRLVRILPRRQLRDRQYEVLAP